MARIGVEETLTDVKQALKEKGHQIVDLFSEEDVKGCDCCVISGLDKNEMGMSTTSIEGPVINADGYNAEDVCQMVEQRLG